MPLTQAWRVVREHRPIGAPTICPVCTARGVGDNQGPVLFPCDPYQVAARVLREAGEQRPVPGEGRTSDERDDDSEETNVEHDNIPGDQP